MLKNGSIDNNDERRRSHLSFLQRRHAAAQHGATVAADLQEDVFVVSGSRPLQAGLQYRRQRGAVDDEAEIQAVDRQAATKKTQRISSQQFKQQPQHWASCE